MSPGARASIAWRMLTIAAAAEAPLPADAVAEAGGGGEDVSPEEEAGPGAARDALSEGPAGVVVEAPQWPQKRAPSARVWPQLEQNMMISLRSKQSEAERIILAQSICP